MGGTSSKRCLIKFDDNPKDYKTQNDLYHKIWEKNEEGWWRVDLRRARDEMSQKEVTRIFIQKWVIHHHQIEFAYQFRFVHKYRLKRPFVKRGVGNIHERPLDFIGFEEYLSTNYLFNFQATVYALIDAKGIRKFNFTEPNLYGKSRRFGGIEVPMESLSRRVPLLAAQLETGERDEKLLGLLPLLLQLLYGVHIQIEAKQIEPILDLAVEYNLDYVRRYCEQQIIRRFDLKFTILQKYEMACKYNLDLLMRHVLVGMNNKRKLKKFAIKIIEIDKMNGKMMKLIAGKIFELV